MSKINDVKKDQQKCGDCRQTQRNATPDDRTEGLEDRQAPQEQKEQTENAHIPQIETKPQQKGRDYTRERMTLSWERQVQTKA